MKTAVFLCASRHPHRPLARRVPHALYQAGCVFVANMLAANDCLLELSLNDCCVRDEGLATLVERGLADNSRLERLELQGNGLTGSRRAAAGDGTQPGRQQPPQGGGAGADASRSGFQRLCDW